MKWFFILIVMVQHNPSEDNLYLIQDPKFSTSQECLQFVSANMWSLKGIQMEKFPNQEIENIYCLTQEALDNAIKDRDTNI